MRKPTADSNLLSVLSAWVRAATGFMLKDKEMHTCAEHFTKKKPATTFHRLKTEQNMFDIFHFKHYSLFSRFCHRTTTCAYIFFGLEAAVRPFKCSAMTTQSPKLRSTQTLRIISSS